LKSVLFKTKPNWIKRSEQINKYSGFYFEDLSQVSNFFDAYDKALLATDILGAGGTAFAWIESRYLENIKKIISVGMTAPWVEAYYPSISEIPWANSLNDKRVLVISPFTESIVKQHEIIDKVFPNSNYPKFVLTTIKAPQTLGFESKAKPSWFENLNQIKQLMLKEDFDIALVSAGAYSYLLAHYAKTLGKIGIHNGGALQLFFGIMGKRWESDWEGENYLKKYVNEYWVRPSAKEKPLKADQVEDGCYW
jgi:hypothetical protein